MKTSKTTDAALIAATDKYLSTELAAKLTGTSVRYINKLRMSGLLPAVILGPKCIRIRESDIHAYMAARLCGGQGKPAVGRIHENLRASRPRRRRSVSPNAIGGTVANA